MWGNQNCTQYAKCRHIINLNNSIMMWALHTRHSLLVYLMWELLLCCWIVPLCLASFASLPFLSLPSCVAPCVQTWVSLEYHLHCIRKSRSWKPPSTTLCSRSQGREWANPWMRPRGRTCVLPWKRCGDRYWGKAVNLTARFYMSAWSCCSKHSR